MTKHDDRDDSKCCKDTIKINEHDINKASRHCKDGYVIKRAGKYVLCEDVRWDNKKDSYAITIDADNVTLDLDGHFIKQDDTTKSGDVAIHVRSSNVVVKNGQLLQISTVGIMVDNGADCVTIDSMNFRNIGYRGQLSGFLVPINAAILFAGTENSPLKHVTVTNCTFCDNGRLGDVFVSQGSSSAVLTNYVNDIVVKNVTVHEFFADAFAIPLNFTNGENLVVSNVNVSNVTSNVFAFGISFTLFDNVIFENFNLTDLKLTLANAAPIPLTNKHGAEAIKLSACNDFVIRRGAVQNVVVETTVPTSLLTDTVLSTAFSAGELFGQLISSNGLVENVIVNNVRSDGGKVAGNLANTAGFICHNVDATQFINCEVFDVNASQGTVFGFGGKRGADANGVVSTDFPNPRNVFKNCSVMNLNNTSEVEGDFAAGYWLYSDREQVLDSSATFIDGNEAYGVFLDQRFSGSPPVAVGEANRCLIRNNTLTNCGTAGIFDNTVAKNSIFSNNYTALNGDGSFPTI